MQILLYTRRGCHLCEQAEDMLAALGVSVGLVDVDAEPGAAARHGLRVPVLEIDGTVALEGRFQERQLAALRAALTARGGRLAGPTDRRASEPT